MMLICFLLASSSVSAKTAYDACDISLEDCGKNHMSIATSSILSFVTPLPEIPTEMVIDGEKHVVYNIANNAFIGKMTEVTTNYDVGDEIMREDKCTSLPAQSSCQIKLKIAPTKAQNLPLRLQIYANAGTIYLTEPTEHTIKVYGVAPTITQQPQSQTIASGKQLSLNVIATGTAPLHYQWYKGNAPVGTDAPHLFWIMFC